MRSLFWIFLPQIYKKSKCFNNQLELSDEVRTFLIDMFLKKTNNALKHYYCVETAASVCNVVQMYYKKSICKCNIFKTRSNIWVGFHILLICYKKDVTNFQIPVALNKYLLQNWKEYINVLTIWNSVFEKKLQSFALQRMFLPDFLAKDSITKNHELV